MTSASHSAPTSSSPLWKYEVFISSSELDTRKNFVDHLYAALVQQGIHTYNDQGFLPHEISPALLKAISTSQISVIVFSRNYAYSSWCLDELEYIMKCKDESGQLVYPIYYDVEPTEVRKQVGRYQKAFVNHESKDRNKAESWRKALADAADIAGWELRNTNGMHGLKALQEKILSDVLRSKVVLRSIKRGTSMMKGKLWKDMSEWMSVLAKLEGVGADALIEKFKDRDDGVKRNILSCGKSTLATSLYEEISHEFEGCCFVKNVSAESRMHGLKALQEKILSDVLRSKVVLPSIKRGTSMMKGKLCQNSVLIVLDDVSHIDHLNKLAGSHDWMLDANEAIKLFIRCAFVAGRPSKGFKEVSLKIVSKFGGHPSALKSMGSFLQGKDMSEWMSVLAKLEGVGADVLIEKFKDGDDGVRRNVHSWLVTSGGGSKDMETCGDGS
nr:hypothetical protein [Tanacetum cinerariifolium]